MVWKKENEVEDNQSIGFGFIGSAVLLAIGATGVYQYFYNFDAFQGIFAEYSHFVAGTAAGVGAVGGVAVIGSTMLFNEPYEDRE